MADVAVLNVASRVAVVDLETLGTGADAAIASIGVVVVDLNRSDRIAQRFYTRVDWRAQTDRATDQGTLAWWGSQRESNRAAFDEVFGHHPGAPSLGEALCRLSRFLDNAFFACRDRLVMGNGPEFDNVILAHAYQQQGLRLPWHYGQNQSLRTVVWLGRMLLGIDPKHTLEFEGIQHHALHDALHEARCLREIVGQLKTRDPIGQKQGVRYGS